jgi:hypothetical protein
MSTSPLHCVLTRLGFGKRQKALRQMKWDIMKKSRIGVLLSIAGMLIALACVQQPARAQAPALLAPDSVTLDTLGYTRTFPPTPDKSRSNCAVSARPGKIGKWMQS